MTRLRDTLSPAERAEFDSLFIGLSPDEQSFVRIMELFMRHELNQAAFLNEEIRGLLKEQSATLTSVHEIVSRQGADLADHERRLRTIEHGGHGHSHHPHGPALTGD